MAPRNASKRWDVFVSFTSGKHNEAASIVNTEPLREPPLGELLPLRLRLILILFATTDERLFVRDNKPGEQVQLLQSARVTLLFVALIVYLVLRVFLKIR